ncbi:hypothetical protein NOVO_00230 [Rickettsiales bacterium Ac37b]|nr:hypothetical protein NOVO_00230 [Rickettsiales bacterium Ac37b]
MKRSRPHSQSKQPSLKKIKSQSYITASEHSVLNNLAKLLEITTLGCTAVCFQNDKILIRDNDINSNTGDTEKLRIIKDVMDYYKKAANTEDKESLKEERMKLFKRVALARIRGENAGYLGNLDNEVIDDIAEDVLNNRGVWRGKDYDQTIRQHPRSSRPSVALSYEILDNLARSFVRVENFIEENKDHPITVAFKNDFKGKVDTGEFEEITYQSFSLMHDKSNPGYAIISPGRKIDKDKAVHAEVKMIDYLVFTRILQNTNKPIYIGISKLCCSDCANIIKECNTYKGPIIKTIENETAITDKQYQDTVQTQGAHNLKFACKAPIFLYDEDSFPPIAFDSLQSGNVGYYLYYENKTLKDAGFQDIKEAPSLVEKGNEVFVYTDFKFWHKLQKQKGVQTLVKNLNSNKGGTNDKHVDQYYHSPGWSEDNSQEELGRSPMRDIDTEFSAMMAGRKNAFNQANNPQYRYQKSDLNAIGSMLVGPQNFIGVVDKNNIREELLKFDLSKKDKIMGIYQATPDKWISFCIQRDKDAFKAYYTDPSGEAPLKDFGITVQEIFDTNCHNSSYYSSLVKEADNGVLALVNLHALNDNPDKPFRITKDAEQYNQFIQGIREKNAEIFMEATCGANSKDLHIVKAAWEGIIENPILNKFKFFLEEKVEEGMMLQFIYNHEKEFKLTDVPGIKGLSLFDVFVKEEGNKINPRTLAIVEELLTKELLESNKFEIPFSPIENKDFKPTHSPDLMIEEGLTATEKKSISKEKQHISEEKPLMVNEVDSTLNSAATRFITPDEKKLTQLEYDSWYSPNTIKDLNNPITDSGIIKYVFFDDLNPVKGFEVQLDHIRILNNMIAEEKKDLSAISFIAKEPGAGQNHFIYGLLIKPAGGGTSKLLVVNPTGETVHKDFYETLAKLQQKIDVEIYVTSTKLQQDAKGLVSCGPICTELMENISNMNPGQLDIILNAQNKAPNVTKEGCTYKSIEIPALLLPKSLKSLFGQQPEEYKQSITNIRRNHFEKLLSLSEQEIQNREEKWAKFQDLMFKDTGELSLKLVEPIIGTSKKSQTTSSTKGTSDVKYNKEFSNLNLKYAEKSTVFDKEFNLQDHLQQNLTIKQQAKLHELALFANIDDQNSNTGKVKFIGQGQGKVVLITEDNHLKDHQTNTEKIMQLINENKIDFSTIIYLERKEEGHNLGMADVRLLANIIKYNEIHQDKIPINQAILDSPIYQDALLLNIAKKHSIKVEGIDMAKSKAVSGINEQDRNREAYMAEKIEKAVQQGKNVIFMVGSEHVNNLEHRLKDRSIEVSINTAGTGNEPKITLVQTIPNKKLEQNLKSDKGR